ncbi:hypothetical protein HJC23_006344 [Cyclotella cryptica]|uniref:Mediator of RNA polymerase II transcription subunit 14 n=1 Tax=Cyclotella cryptica TaxID=29204 RepID=A0ABD3Q3F3_9STRA|eukprot:CCRYP_008740-RA/>CCRYP_008740-RA protein AED:0.31 eAED:0.31 QI:0/-1/0/1/-1/1/1/0/862
MFLTTFAFFFHILNGRFVVIASFAHQRASLIICNHDRNRRSESIHSRNTRAWAVIPSVDDDEANGAHSVPKQNVTKTKVAETTRLLDAREVYGPDSASIPGLLPNQSFELNCRLHCTLTLLRKYFPTLLDLPPISTTTAKQWIYDANVTVTGPRGEQLAVGIDEVMGVTRALAVATTAARRAGSFLDMAVAGRGASTSSASTTPISDKVECELLMDPNNPFRVLALWRTRLPAPSITNSDRQYTEFTGKSILELSRRTGRVSNLQIKSVQINGVAIIESLGSTLATIRRTARSSPIFESLSGSTSSSTRSSGNPLLDGILNGIRDAVDAVDALPSSSDVDEAPPASPLYILPEIYLKNTSSPAANEVIDGPSMNDNLHEVVAEKSNEKASSAIPVGIDEYSTDDPANFQFPIVGSVSFVEYALLHQSLVNFANDGLHQLAGTANTRPTKETVRSLFSTDARLTTSTGKSSKTNDNYTTLLKGAGNVADLYRSLSLLRESSGGDWTAKSFESNWRKRWIVVSWESKSPVKVEGSDKFVFEKPVPATSFLPLISDGDKDDIAKRCSSFFNDLTSIPLKVDRIENLSLTVGGVAADSEWANSFIAAALRTGIAGSAPLPDATVSELLRALANRQSTSKTSPSSHKETTSSLMPMLEDSAAASFYGILRSLHFDLSNIGDADTKSSSPAGAFLAEDIELRGLLGERLVSGVKAYNRLIGVAISSLRAAMQTNRVRLAAAPTPTIEVTAKGSIKVNFILALWIDAPTFPLTQSGSQTSGGFGVPLKMQLVSEYIIDKSGKIREHIILESRLNGVLTPGDVFSRWIKSLTSSSSNQGDVTDGNGMPAALVQLVGALSWVRSMQNRKNK